MNRPTSPSLTIADVARHVHLARSTVSMALRHHPEIAPETRERVIAAATALGYQANPLVTALMANLRGHRRTPASLPLALVHEYPENVDWRRLPLMRAILEGLTAEAERHGYTLQDFRLGPDGLSPARLSAVLAARGIAGAILAPLPRTNLSHFTAFSELATVTIGWSVAQCGVHRSSFDHFRNMLLAWDTLAHRGYQRIGFIYTTEQSRWSGLAYLGGFLSRNNAQPTARRVTPLAVEVAEEMTAPCVRNWLEREQPDAVIVSNADHFVPLAHTASGGLTSLAVIALEVSSAPPGTAGIDEQSFLVGTAAIDLLVTQLHRNQRGMPEVPSIVSLPGIWREGQTVRAGDALVR